MRTDWRLRSQNAAHPQLRLYCSTAPAMPTAPMNPFADSGDFIRLAHLSHDIRSMFRIIPFGSEMMNSSLIDVADRYGNSGFCLNSYESLCASRPCWTTIRRL